MKIKDSSRMQKSDSQHFLTDAKLCKKQDFNQNVSLVNTEISLKRNSDDLTKSASAERGPTLLTR